MLVSSRAVSIQVIGRIASARVETATAVIGFGRSPLRHLEKNQHQVSIVGLSQIHECIESSEVVRTLRGIHITPGSFGQEQPRRIKRVLGPRLYPGESATHSQAK